MTGAQKKTDDVYKLMDEYEVTGTHRKLMSTS